MTRVAVVTDSTAYLPPDTGPVSVVPLRVHLGTRRTLVDGVDLTAADVLAALRAREPVKTSRPSPAEFAAAFRSCLDEGATHVVSVHLAAALSGTWESAVLASQDFGHGVVRVVDSRSAAGGLGFAVRAAAAAAAAGEPASAVQQAAVEVIDRTSALFYVDTLDHLRRGGRIGTAASLLATSLSIRPLLQMVEGRVVPLEKVRTPTRALAKLVARSVEAAGDTPAAIAVHHLAAATRASGVVEQLRAAFRPTPSPDESEPPKGERSQSDRPEWEWSQSDRPESEWLQSEAPASGQVTDRPDSGERPGPPAEPVASDAPPPGDVPADVPVDVPVYLAELGPVLGVHLGPGAIGVVVVRGH